MIKWLQQLWCGFHGHYISKYSYEDRAFVCSGCGANKEWGERVVTKLMFKKLIAKYKSWRLHRAILNGKSPRGRTV